MNKIEFAKALGWKVSNLAGRLDALGLLEVCGRCGGSGRYSFNQMDGDKCYGCMGRTRTYPTFTAKLVATVQAKVAAGGLDAYLAECRAKNAARLAIAPLAAQAREIYDTIGNAYTVASRGTNSADIVVSPVFFAQGLNNDLYWGTEKGTSAPVEHQGVTDLVRALQYGADPAAVLREMTLRVDMLETLRAAWLARVDSH